MDLNLLLKAKLRLRLTANKKNQPIVLNNQSKLPVITPYFFV
jgi:hypothetical protein